MCGTCGCSSDNKVTITKPHHHHHNDEHQHQHHHDVHHEHHHQHDDHHHNEHHPHHHNEHHHPKTVIELEKDILHQNNINAAKNRGFFEAKSIFTINLVSSPGSGKTSLLEKTIADLKNEHLFYVIEGDQQTMNDANRIAALQIPVIQINTGKGCHLESDMVFDAVKKLELSANSVLFIENVGNLVCPSMFDLGEDKRVVIISVTEGEDKPLKYPDMFLSSDVCVINKTDLLPYLNFDVALLKENALKVNHHLQFFEVSATSGQGMEKWYEWLIKNKK